MSNSKNSLHSEGPWSQEATMSSDSRFIRYINNANGRVVAEVRYAEGAEQDENLLNASLLAASPQLLRVLEGLFDDVHKGLATTKDNETLVRMRQVIDAAREINSK